MGQQNLNIHPMPRRLLSLILAGALVGCSGVGTGVTFDTSLARAEVNENTSSSFWKARAKAGNNSVKYSLSGNDAGIFNIDQSTGALTFKQPADFEQPKDSDRDNEYVIDITAQVEQSSATQNLRVKVKDVAVPTVALVSPQANANVGQGDNVEVEASVRVYDQESKGPLNSGSVTVNGVKLTKDSADPTLWKGLVQVPAGGMDVEVAATTEDNVVIKETAKWINKPGSLKPQVMALVPGGYIATIDSAGHFMTKIYLSGMPQWVEYAGNDDLFKPLKSFDFNSRYQTAYFSNEKGELMAASIASAVPKMYYAGAISGLLGLTYDSSGNRLLVLSAKSNKGGERFEVSAVPLNNLGFANARTAETKNQAAKVSSLWNMYADESLGVFKAFNYHRASKTYIIADERIVDGTARTFVQGYDESAQKRFTAEVGGDISVLAVDEAAGVVYAAENSRTPEAKLKAINLSTGAVSDLVDAPSTSVIGAFSDLRMDNVNKKLYVSDAVAGSIFVVDLAAKSMIELNHMPAFTGDPTLEN
jgi:hypothetical protein